MQNYRKSTNVSQAQILNHFQKAQEVMRKLTGDEKNQKTVQSQYKIKSLKEINSNLEIVVRRCPTYVQKFANDKIIVYIRHSLLQSIPKFQVLNYLRLVMVSQEISNKYLNNNIPIYISRLLERDDSKCKYNNQDDAYEALRFIHEWIQKYPKTFPKLLAATLVAYAQLPITQRQEERKKDHITSKLKILAFEAILEMSIKNTKLCVYSGGFSLISNAIIDPSFRGKNYQIICRVLYFLNEKKNRQLVLGYIDIRKIFNVFVDLDNAFAEQSYRLRGNMEASSKLQTQLSLAKYSIVTLLKSWIGVVYLGNEKTTLHSFLQALKQIPKNIDSQIRKTIYSVLQQILSIGDNLIRQNLSFQENQFRVCNLVNCYMITLVELLLQHDLFKILIELSGVSQTNIADPAKKILKKLSIYIFNFFPNSSKYFDFLISAATTQDFQSLILKSSSSFIVNEIGNYIYQPKSTTDNNLLADLQNLFCSNITFVPIGRRCLNSISKQLNFLTDKEKPLQHKNLVEKNPISKDNKDNYKKWDWDVLEELLNHPEIQKNKNFTENQKQKQTKMLRILARFFYQEKGKFSQIKWDIDNFQYIRVGKMFIKNCLIVQHKLNLVKNPPASQFQATISFIGQLQKQLTNTFSYMLKSQQGYYMPFFKNFNRELILWIGLLSESIIGFEQLLCKNDFFEIIYANVAKPKCGLLISTLLFYFDYYLQNKPSNIPQVKIGPRALLQKCVEDGCKRLKISCLQIIRLLFKAELKNFQMQGFRLILSLLSDDNTEIVNATTAILEDLLIEKQLVGHFVSCVMQCEKKQYLKCQKFSKFCTKLTTTILMKMISLPQGFAYINKHMPKWLQEQYVKWVHVQQQSNYCLRLEQMLNLSLNFTKDDDNGYQIKKARSFTEMIYLYKIPWLLLVNDEEVPLWTTMTKTYLLLTGEWTNRTVQELLEYNQSENIRISLCIGNMHVDEQLQIKHSKPYQTILQLEEGVQVQIDGQKLYKLQKNQIKLYLKALQDGDNTINQYEVRKVTVQISIQFDSEFEQLPMHLVQELTRTPQGRQFLQQKSIIKHAQQVLQKQQSSALQVRSILWSMGYYGSTAEGMTSLIKCGLAKTIIQMSFNCQTLSLRGTCRYVLNMFCHSEVGRSYLSVGGYQVNKKYLNCFPQKSAQFYHIDKYSQVQHYCQQQHYWDIMKTIQKPMTQNQQKLYNAIGMLLNSLSGKFAVSKIKELLRKNYKITHSLNLYQNVINLMTFYRFRYESRKNIHSIFEEFLKSPDFNSEIANKITYFTLSEQ